MMANVLKLPGTSAKGPGTGAIRIVLHHHVGALRRAIRRWRPGLCMRDGEMLMCPTTPRTQSDGDRGHGSSPPRAGAAGPPRRVRLAERTIAESTGSLRAALARRMHKARSTLATILVALTAVLLSPLHAQAQTTFVSNLNQPSEGNLSNVQDRAQSFTTGTHDSRLHLEQHRSGIQRRRHLCGLSLDGQCEWCCHRAQVFAHRTFPPFRQAI